MAFRSNNNQSVELRQLVYLDAVVRHGGFTRAAEALHVAQPAVSAQIRRLERELDAQLLERSTRRVSVTHAGEVFLARVRAALAELDAARADLADMREVVRGEVRVGATLVLGSLDLPGVLARFRRRHPGVALSLRTGLIAELRAQLDAGELDVVLGPLDPVTTAGRRTIRLVDERVVLITAPGRAVVRLADVAGEPFVCLPGTSGLRTLLDRAAAAAGFEPRVEFETRSAASVRQLVSAGLGVAVLAESAAREPGAPIAIHELRPAPRHPPIGLVEPAGRRLTPAARAFRDELAGARRT